MIGPVTAARGRVLAAVLAAGREGAPLAELVLGPDSRRAVGALIGDGKLLVCGQRVLRRARVGSVGNMVAAARAGAKVRQ